MREGKEIRMNRFIVKTFVFFLAINLWNIGLFVPLTSNFGGDVTVAKANHRSGGGDRGNGGGRCRRDPSRCQPPTVSELPIQYMILSGTAVIALSGSTIFYIRKRKMKNSTEA
jgi:hypothetical protein